MTDESDNFEFFTWTQEMRDRFDALTARLAAAYQPVPLQQGMAEINMIAEQERKHP
jgi:hypothetical protein